MKENTLSIIIPAYNEEQTLMNLLEKVYSVKLINAINKEFVIIDDCSTDRTFEIANDFKNKHQDCDINIFKQEVNKGKGAAIHRGIDSANGEFLIIQDADLEYDPNEYNILLKPVTEGFADVVYGSRFKSGLPHRILFYWHSVGNKILTNFSNMFTNLNLSDMETCYKLFRSEFIKPLKLKENRFGFEPEVTAKISRIKGIRIYEVGISYYGRRFEEGKKINWKDGFRAIYCILKYNIWSK